MQSILKGSSIVSSDLGEFVWRYIHTHDPVGRLIRLSSDGRIVGSEHPNEYYWELEDSCLIFKSIDHQKSVVFNLNDSPLGRDIINGKFVLIPGLGITTQLIKDDKVKVLAIRSAYEAADTVKRLHDSIDVSYTETHYGGRDYHSDSYLSHAFDLLTFHNAEIINKYGVIKCDQILIDESLFHFPFFQEKQILKISDACAGYAPKQASLKFGSALNAALGISGNYYHWMIFFIARMGLLAASEPARKNYTILLPDYLDPVQRQSAEVVAAHYGIPIARICDGLGRAFGARIEPDQGQAGAARHAALGQRVEKGGVLQFPPHAEHRHPRDVVELQAELSRPRSDVQGCVRPAVVADDVRLAGQRPAHDEIHDRASDGDRKSAERIEAREQGQRQSLHDPGVSKHAQRRRRGDGH